MSAASRPSPASPAFARTQHKSIRVAFEGEEFTVTIDDVTPFEALAVARHLLRMVAEQASVDGAFQAEIAAFVADIETGMQRLGFDMAAEAAP